MPHIPASPALARFRVLDLTRVRAGPTAVRLLGDFGADVVKVEPPPGTDPSVGISGDRHDYEMQNLQRNRRSLTLNLKEPDGLAVFLKLVTHADVVVENYRPDVKFRLGIDYESLKAVNRGIVLASISGFGQDGPYAGRPGFDQIAQGMSGFMSVTGEAERGPMRAGGAVADISTGLLTAFGIVTALLERETSGEGQWVQANLLSSAMSLIDFHVARYLRSGELPVPVGNDHPTSVPTSAYRTSDGHINIAASGDAIWKRLALALGHPEWLERPEFRTNAGRAKNRRALNEAIGEALASRPSGEWIELLNREGVPCGPIYTLDRVFEDPQVRHLEAAATLDHPVLGPIRVQSTPVKLSRTPGGMARPTPEYGEHTDELLRELGLPDAEIARLRAARVV
jgi:crotonobetainyl-CoA:carnitine CoA-transferase CaiB-like acyl-CoA transferase